MSPNWTKWVILSLSKYANTYFTGDDIWIQGELRAKNLSPERYEIRFLGPDIEPHTQNESCLYLVINIMVSSERSATNLERHLDRVGKAQAFMQYCIPTYRYGSNVSTDTKAVFYPLQLEGKIETTLFPSLDPVTKIETTTVEGTYKIEVGE